MRLNICSLVLLLKYVEAYFPPKKQMSTYTFWLPMANAGLVIYNLIKTYVQVFPWWWLKDRLITIYYYILGKQVGSFKQNDALVPFSFSGNRIY